MFQFTTTNVINQNTDLTTGKPLWSVQEAQEGKPASLNVKRVNNFIATNIIAIYKAEAHDAEFAKATINLSQVNGTPGAIFRLHIYVGLSQASHSSLYANDLQWKGKPFSIDFVWEDSAANTATKLVKTINKYSAMVYNKKLLNVTHSGTFITVEATDEYQRFRFINIEKFDAAAYHGMGEYNVVRSLDDLTEAKTNAAVTATAEGYFVGKEGFGTYPFLLHNLRLPTYARNRWLAPNQDETPVVGAKYNQYTIYYCVNRGILGDNAVGDVVKSRTTHVFYVRQDLATEFEIALGKVGTVITVDKAGTPDPGTLSGDVETLQQDVAQLKTQLANKADKTELAAKANTADLANYATTESLTSGLAEKANTSHTHTMANITDLQGALDAKANASDLANYATTTALAGKANTVHTHAITDVTDLQTTLAGKADTSALAGKQDTLSAGEGIDIAGNSVAVKLDGDTLTKSA